MLNKIIKWLNGYTEPEYLNLLDRHTKILEKFNKQKVVILELLDENIKLSTDFREYKLKHELPVDTQRLIDYYNTKYPAKDVKYNGTIIHTKQGDIKPEIKVRDYITITQSMIEWIESRKLKYTGDYSVEDISKHSWKVYSEFIKYTSYITDKELYGEVEKWVPNMLQIYIKDASGNWLADCENMTLLCMGLLYASGIPNGLFRNTCGLTKLGGHSSLTVWDYRTKRFEQWETTAKKPTIVKETDDISINEVWFSFDKERSWTVLDKTVYDKIRED